MRAGRARPRAAWLALSAWLGTTALLVAFGPRGFAPLFAVAGVYVVGPLWTPVRYRVDDAGVERRTAFGTRRLAWAEIGTWGVDDARRSAWLAPKGRGGARFLPPLLLLWEEREQREGLAARLTAWLAGRVGDAGA